MKKKSESIQKMLARYGRTLAESCQKPVTLARAPWEVEKDNADES